MIQDHPAPSPCTSPHLDFQATQTYDKLAKGSGLLWCPGLEQGLCEAARPQQTQILNDKPQ